MRKRFFQISGIIAENTLKILAWSFAAAMALFVLAGPPLFATGLLVAVAWGVHPFAGLFVGLAGGAIMLAGAATLWRSIMD